MTSTPRTRRANASGIGSPGWLAVEAAVTGSRQIALQAMLADPVVQNMDAATECLDEPPAVHTPYLPRFQRQLDGSRPSG